MLDQVDAAFFTAIERAGLPTTRSPAATSRMTTVPAPVSAPSPIVTGATSELFEPIMDVAAPDRGRVLVHAVVVAGDRARTDVGVFADRGIAQIRQVVGLHAVGQPRVLQLHVVADAHVGTQDVAAAQVRERPDRRARADRGIEDDAFGHADIVVQKRALLQTAVRSERAYVRPAASCRRSTCWGRRSYRRRSPIPARDRSSRDRRS